MSNPLLTMAADTNEENMRISKKMPDSMKEILLRKQQKKKEEAQEQAADILMAIRTQMDERRQKSLAFIRSMKKAIADQKNMLDRIEKAWAYGLETGNFYPALETICNIEKGSLRGHLASPTDIAQQLTDLLQTAITRAGYNTPAVPVEPFVPIVLTQYGDYQSNFAFRLGKVLRVNPHTIAIQLVNAFPKHPMLREVKVAGGGFINVHLDDSWTMDSPDMSFTEMVKNACKGMTVEELDELTNPKGYDEWTPSE